MKVAEFNLNLTSKLQAEQKIIRVAVQVMLHSDNRTCKFDYQTWMYLYLFLTSLVLLYVKVGVINYKK